MRLTQITLFTAIRPYLFTTYFNVWQRVMEQPVPWGDVAAHSAYLGLYSIGFYMATWYIFVTKDVLS